MAIATYADLKASICDWMFDRQDLATIAADCIALAEGDMNMLLHTRRQLVTVDLVPTDGIVTLPSDYSKFKTVSALTNPRIVLDAYVQGALDSVYTSRHSGSPSRFTVEGSNLYVLPLNSSDIELTYYRKIPPLGEAPGFTTNWLLTTYPNTYLYGSLKYAAIYIGNESKAQMYGGLFNAAIDGLQRQDEAEVYGDRTIARSRGRHP